MLALVLVASCAVLVSSFALAQADTELPPNTIDCAAFKEERSHGAIGQKMPTMLLNHVGAASPPP